MNRGTLTLQSRSKQIERIDSTGAERSTKSANAGCGEVTECHVVLVTFLQTRFAPSYDLLEILKGCEVDGTVREHANETHGKAAVKGANAIGSPHLASSGEDQGIAVKTTFDSLVLDTAGSKSVSGLALAN